MEFYKDYFGIKPDYAPVMTLSDINKSADTWLAFYPHESFIDILRELLKNLNGGNKTVWITGAYGTGKSHASLVLQKLFMDEDVRVHNWLELRKNLIPETVKNALLLARNAKPFIVYDINSDGVDAKNQFLMRLQRKITSNLEQNGYRVPLKGRLEEVLERIRQDGEYFFQARDEIQSKLSYLNAEITSFDVLKQKIAQESSDGGLVNDMMLVLERRKIYLDITAEEFLQWIEAVLRENDLSQLIYIWDEFSAFVDKNRSELKTFEQLAEAAQQGSFYFIPVTHTHITAYVAEGSESAKRANYRFVFKQLQLPNETALKLAADAFVVKSERADDWIKDRDDLWHSIKALTENYMHPNGAGIDCEDFKGILPVHPMAAFLLKHLSGSSIGSNQRSMFEFLNGEEFKTFLNTGGLSVSGRQFLTVDHLWSYFIERDDLGTQREVLEIRTEFARRVSNLQPDQQRVFKSVLLFSLIEQIQGTAHSLLCATVENITRSFEGDGALHGVDAILQDLEHEHCFSIVNGRCERFHDRTNTKDIQDKKDQLMKKFNELVLKDTEISLQKLLKSVNHGSRFTVSATSITGLSASSISKVNTFGDMGNKILLLFVLAKDEQEQLLTPGKIKALAEQYKDHRMLFISIPSVSFCRDSANAWDVFVENNARLALTNDGASKKLFETQIATAKDDWNSKVGTAGKLVIYKPNLHGEPFVEDVTWGQLKKDWLIDYAKQSFSCYTDAFGGFNLTAFGVPSGLQSWAMAGIEFDKYSKPGAYKTVIASWKRHGITGDNDWFEQNPHHVITKIKDYCKKRLDNTVGAGSTCSVRKIYIDLQRPPYGLLSVSHSAFVLGFVLKPWLSGKRKLQWTDGITSKVLDATALAEIIEAVVKDDGANKIKNEKLICSLSREEKAFIAESSVIFGSSPLVDGTVETALIGVGERLEKIAQRVPLWVVPDFIAAQDEPEAENMRLILEKICTASSISSKGNTDIRVNCIKEIGAILLATPGISSALGKYMNPQVFEEAFRLYVDTTLPQLKGIAVQIEDNHSGYYEEIKSRFVKTSGWLWKQDDTLAVLTEVHKMMLCIMHIRKSSNKTGYMNFEQAYEYLRKKVQSENKVSLELLLDKYPSLKTFLELVVDSTVNAGKISLLEETLVQQSKLVEDVFFDNTKEVQLAMMKDVFGGNWPNNTNEAQSLYSSFHENSSMYDRKNFQELGQKVIDEYMQKSASAKLLSLWQQHTNTSTPEEWSKVHNLPAECVLNVEGAKAITDIILNPYSVAATRLQEVHTTLERADVFGDNLTAGQKFLSRILPSRYLKFDLTVKTVSSWLSQELGDNPNVWLSSSRVNDAIDKLIRQEYDVLIKGKAENKLHGMSDAESKKLLLQLIKRIPDVGLAMME